MVEGISLLDVIKEGGYEASLITTFNANLPFYEEVVLRRLVAAGCQQNVVLMDQKQCAASWQSEASRPRLAGAAYSLVPISVSGVFHPKVCILVGKKKATILIGSHNLTLSGFGYNREVCNRIDVSGESDTEGRAALFNVWKMVTEWIECGASSLPSSLVESVLSFSKNIQHLSKAGPVTGPTILHQHPGSASLMEQVSHLVSFPVHRIGVIGAFFDSDLAFLEQLNQRWPDAEIVVAIDPDTVHLPHVRDVKARFVDARFLWSGTEDGDKYLHAKAIYIEQTPSENSLFISGSANPSRPAWLGEYGTNIEAVVARGGPDAQAVATKLGLLEMFSLAAISEEELQATAARSIAEVRDSSANSTILLVGVPTGKNELWVEMPTRDISVESANLLGADEEVLQRGSDIRRHEDGFVIPADINIHLVRSCELYFNGHKVGRVMVEHPQLLAATVKPSHRQVRDAIGAIDPSGESISEMVKAVERAVFDLSNEKQVESEIRTRRGALSAGASSEKPDSLEVSVSQISVARKTRRKIVESADMVTLIDLLSRKIGQELRDSDSVPVDWAGRNEEEQVGTEDTSEKDAVEDPVIESHAEIQHQIIEDTEIALRVSKKVGKLVTKMLSKLNQADSIETQTRALVQLIAVLSLIKELWRIERLPRWRLARELLVSEGSRHLLLGEAMSVLFGSRTRLIQTLTEEGRESEEAIQLRLLLLWLAWTVKVDVPDEDPDNINVDDRQKMLGAKAIFLALTPAIADDHAAYAELHNYIKITRSPNPISAVRAESWVRRTVEFGERWSRELTDAPQLEVGGCCIVGAGDYPRLVSQVGSDFVSLWEFERPPRRFCKSVVIPVQPSRPVVV